jgi:hypothetical protein
MLSWIILAKSGSRKLSAKDSQFPRSVFLVLCSKKSFIKGNLSNPRRPTPADSLHTPELETLNRDYEDTYSAD